MSGVLRRLRIENLVLIREAELELDAGLNAITGETGAGKTILSNAIGLLLGARGDAALIGAAGDEAYVEAEFDLADDDALGALAELRPEGEDGLVLARRIFADGRTRAYAWGRSAAREDVAAAAEGLIAMSGQFEQRRLARPAYQLGVLDAFAGLDVRAAQRAWRELQAARRRLHDELTRDADAASARLEELRALAADTDGLAAGQEDELRAERERLRHVDRARRGGATAAAALRRTTAMARPASSRPPSAPSRRSSGSRPSSPRRRRAPAPGGAAAARDRIRPAAFLASLEAEPGRLEQVEAELDRFADLEAPLPRADVRRAARARGGGAA